MTKTIKIIIIVSSIYLAMMISLGITIALSDWSWWWLFWAIAIPLVGVGSALIVINIKNSDTKKEEIEDKNPDVEIDEIKQFVKNWVEQNKDHPVDQIVKMTMQPYTPKQEGINKLSVYKLKLEGYNGKKRGGFDILFLATDRKKKKVLMYKDYEKDNNEAEEDFDNRIEHSVVNPEKIVETENIITDALGQTRTIKKKTPAQMLKQAEEHKQTKKEESEEGVDEE